MNLYSFQLEEALCELDVFFTVDDMESFADVVVGAGFMGQYDLAWPPLEEWFAQICTGG